jgi:GNAT superfamily N-acetyltransferase
MLDCATDLIAGYFTLSAASIHPTDLPSDISKRMPNYPLLPAMLIGRLALDQRFHAQGVGEILLIHALGSARRLTDRIGAIAVLVEANDDRARQFYERFQFVRLASNEYRLAISMKAIDKLYGS